jgi:hypothetical protein
MHPYDDLRVQNQLYPVCLLVYMCSHSSFKVSATSFKALSLSLSAKSVSSKPIRKPNQQTILNPQYSGHITLFFTKHMKLKMFKCYSYLLHNNGIYQHGAMVRTGLIQVLCRKDCRIGPLPLYHLACP